MKKEKFIEKCKLTHETNYIYDRVPDNIDTNKKQYVEIGCPKCNTYWKVRYDSFQKGSNCSCFSKRKLKEENFEKIKSQHPELDFTNSVYNGTQSNIEFNCKIHGKQILSVQTLLKENSECPICNSQKMAKEALKKQVKTNFSLALIDKERISATEEILVICNTCGRIFRSNRRKIAKTTSCPECSFKKRAKAKSLGFEEFLKKAKKNYTYFELFYKNATTKTLIRCNKCFYTFWQTPRNHLNSNQGCPICGIEKRTNSLRLKEEEVIERIKVNIGNKFDFLNLAEPYKNEQTKATIQCKICNYKYTANCMVLSNREIVCKNCLKNYNIAEERLKALLFKKGIRNIRAEATFTDLVYVNNLRFDIFLPEYKTAIEIQGYHHYKPYKYSYTQTNEEVKASFEKQVEKDRIKVEWCKLHNVKLITIPYSKVRRISGARKVVNSLTLEKTNYDLQEIEKNFQTFILTEELEKMLF